MPADKHDVMHVDFDRQWECYHRPTNKHTDDVSDISFSNIMNENHQWSNVTLPHIIDSITEVNHDNTNQYDWWYRKQFHWVLFDEKQKHQVYLMFKSSDSEHDSNILNINATIWLNGKEIFSHALLPQSKLLELTDQLLTSNNTTENNKSKNILIVRCINTSLSLRACLVIHGEIIWASGQIKTDDEIITRHDEDSNHRRRRRSSIFDYSVRVSGDDRRIGVVFEDSEQAADELPFSPSFTEQPVEFVDSEPQINESKENLEDVSIPRLAIVILIVGTRGDVQPFIALGQALLAFGHRVRLATHEIFRSFVRSNGLEFYPLAGDPADLMSFMVKNAGIIPSMSSIVAGDVSRKRHTLADILESTWLACIANDDETSLPFTAEAIIANPPSFGHVHCAEKLQIPLHIMFTMPWSPTSTFPHPFCNIDCSKGPTKRINVYSYHVVEMLTWSGMRGIVNHFRRKTLGLFPLHAQQATNLLIDERVPHTYCWSPSLVPKPSDWETHIDVSGYFFLNLSTTYTNPPQDLLNFLGISDDDQNDRKLSPPIYIGFGSITGHDCQRLLRVVIDALNKTGYRALVAGLATKNDQLPGNILKIDNIPHDWLFQYVSAVCHHGGAGTTAAGLRAGKPTIIVPFFGDQFFWGNMIEKSGAGPRALPGKSVMATELAEAFQFVHRSTVRDVAKRIRAAILKENGCQAAVRSFHANLPLSRMRSDLQSTFTACYRIDKFNIQISRPVAYVLVAAGAIDVSQLHSHHIREWQLEHDHQYQKIAHNVTENIGKRRSTTVTDSDMSPKIKYSSSTNDLKLNAYDNTKNIHTNFQQDTGHLSVHSSSSNGKMHGKFHHTSPLHKSNSESNTSQHLNNINYKANIKTTVLSLCHNRKAGLINFLKKPRFGHQQHLVTGNTAEALITTAKYAMHPAVSSLPPPTYSIQSSHNTVKKIDQTSDTNGTDSQSKDNVKEEQEADDGMSSAIKNAATLSGFHPGICEEILLKFDQIKKEREQTTTELSPSKRHSHNKLHLIRQRSYSTSAVNETSIF